MRHEITTEVIITGLFVFALAGFLGFEVIRRVPKLLHTPLMALTNALSAIALVGSMIILGFSETTYSKILGFVAVVASTINVVGGFLLTDRMLKMFKRREPPKVPTRSDTTGATEAGS
ncbi:MAG: H+-translocating transhydrogenase subunit alpha [Miltoncostaeaceae bacterium]|jgi:NAD(P) transhydrogenase subunit alpha|nr:H+-translocating transhydrogenase subunit alpha [Miltoncostaeaceae bacterium]